MIITPNVRRLVDIAIEEDLGGGDLTTELIFPAPTTATAHIVSRAKGVLCGSKLAVYIFQKIDPDLKVNMLLKDGSRFDHMTTLLGVEGSLSSILAAERIVLNFLSRLSGISTMTASYAQVLADTSSQIVDTRKTTPGWRYLEKYAVRTGGGCNHRLNLHEAVLIKDNHIAAAGSVRAAVAMAASKLPATIKLEVEVDNLDQLRDALVLPEVDIIMLDNMSVVEMTKAVSLVAGKKKTEASGNITLERLSEVASSGVDYISAGALTHSASSLDLSLEIREGDRS